jgi:hypothetical protein
MKRLVILFLLLAKVAIAQVTSSGGSAGSINYVGASSGAAPPYINPGVLVVGYKTGVDFKTNATTDIFTVPAGKTFALDRVSFVITAVNSGASVTPAVQILESGGATAMSASGGPGSGVPVVGKTWTLVVNANNPTNACTATNKVQLTITTGYTTSTAVTGTVWVYGFYL